MIHLRQIMILAFLLALAGTARPTSVQADTGAVKPILVLESYVGPRPAEMDGVMSTLDDLLETRGFAARPATILRFAGQGVPRPGILDSTLTAARIAQHLNDGWAKFIAARWDDAISALGSAIDEVHRNPTFIVNDMTNLDLTRQLRNSERISGSSLGRARRMNNAISAFSTV